MKIAVDNTKTQAIKKVDTMLTATTKEAITILDKMANIKAIIRNTSDLAHNIVMHKELVPGSPITPEVQAQFQELKANGEKFKKELEQLENDFGLKWEQCISWIRDNMILHGRMEFIFDHFAEWNVDGNLPPYGGREFEEQGCSDKTSDLLKYHQAQLRLKSLGVSALKALTDTGRQFWKYNDYFKAKQYIEKLVHQEENITKALVRVKELADKVGDPDALEAMELTANWEINSYLSCDAWIEMDLDQVNVEKLEDVPF